jgi:hypothetical protein
MSYFWHVVGLLFLAIGALAWRAEHLPPAPTKTETLSCVRAKEVTPAGTINYLCEVKK